MDLEAVVPSWPGGHNEAQGLEASGKWRSGEGMDLKWCRIDLSGLGMPWRWISGMLSNLVCKACAFLVEAKEGGAGSSEPDRRLKILILLDSVIRR